MSSLNSFSCLNINSNTGVGSCPVNPRKIIGVILTPKGFSADTSTLANFKTALVNAALNATKSGRIYPIYDLREPQESGGDPVKQTFNTGQVAIVRDNFLVWMYDFIAGGIELLVKLRALNAATTSHDFYFIDDQNFVLGVADATNDKLKAIPSDGGYFYAHAWKQNDGSKVTKYTIECSFDPKYVNELLGYVKADFDVQTTVYGLQDVVLTSPSANVTAGSYNVTATIVNGSINMGDSYSSELATIGNWKATNTQTGATIAVLTAVYNALGYTVVGLGTTDANYPATAGDKVTLSFQPPATLATNSLEGFESNSVDIVHN